MIKLPLPDITGRTPSEQILQLKDYLYQLVGYLQNEQQAAQIVAGRTQPTGVDLNGAEAAVTPESWNATKALILKSAQIVEAFSEKISAQLKGEYVATSDFGTYTEQTSAKLEATDKAVEQLYTDLQMLDTETQQLRNTTAYIRSGQLDTDSAGHPVYGIEVGQQNITDGQETFHAFARFTAGKLSFYDNNRVEVAYVSNYKMYITNVEITRSLTGGGYEVDFSDGWAWKWIGG